MGNPSVPKQFIDVDGKPIIIHTLQLFESVSEIDGIQIVCISEWIDVLNDLLERFDIKKVLGVVPGGETSQLSIHNGLIHMVDHLGLNPEALVMIHDGVRPLVSKDTLRQNLIVAEQFGNAITTSPCAETIMFDDENGLEILDRDKCRIARAPQTFKLGEIKSYYDRCRSEGVVNCIDSATMVKRYGVKIHTIEGNPENIKITTPMDVCLFRGLINRDGQ